MVAPNTILQNRYRIVRELGHGGAGTVYEASDQRVNSIVAIKKTLATRDAEARRAFEHEAALLANLRHQALPKVMDYFSEGDGDFLVMEFIPGYDLAELLDLRGSPFPQSQVLRWAGDLLRVLEYLHGQEPPILHRDIKPSNLKLTKQGEIFLLDFGLAKGSVGQMPTYTTSRSVRGYTPVYASLEQILGYRTDARSDIYSVGATLYHLLTGVAPIDAPARFHAVEDEESDPLQPVHQLNSQASVHVSEVIQQAMALSRKGRPVSAAEMRKALRNAIDEDERDSAEEEYARAELRHRAREAKARASADQSALLAEQALLDAETRKKNSAGRDQSAEFAESGHRVAMDPRHAHEDEREDPSPPVTLAASTVASETIEASPVFASPEHDLPGATPERFTTHQLSSRQTIHPEKRSSTASRRRRAILLTAFVVVVLGIGVFGIWLLPRPRSQSGTINDRPLTALQPTENKPIDSKPIPPEGMVYVPGGDLLMGRDDGDNSERPVHHVSVKPFFIDVHEVTLADYAKFTAANPAYLTPQTAAGFENGNPDEGKKPAVQIPWDFAVAYCKSLGKRLPIEEEWEFAARGTDGRRYPWGNDWQPGLANANGASKGMAEVGAHKGTSPFGAYDMVGNAWEWTASDFHAYPGGRQGVNPRGGELKVIRGGSFESTKDYATTTYRAGWPARSATTYDQTGFRCAQDVAK